MSGVGCPGWERALGYCGVAMSALEADRPGMVLSALGDPQVPTSLYPSFLIYKVEQIPVPWSCPQD